jgi:hypothetical protein
MTQFIPRRDVQAVSHVNVVVEDIEAATELYGNVLTRTVNLAVWRPTRRSEGSAHDRFRRLA